MKLTLSLLTVLMLMAAPVVGQKRGSGPAVPPPTQGTGSAPAPASKPAPTAKPVPAASASYVIGPQDQLFVTVSDEDELTGKFRVDGDGSIAYPYLGRIRVAGKSLTTLQGELTTLLANGYLKNPQVRVEVDQYKSRRVFVTGEVRAPNEYAMTGTMTLLQALAMAGSPTSSASNEVIVSRQDSGTAGQPEIIRINRRDLELGTAGFDLMLQDGDIINVPMAQRFYISGAVRNPGYYVLDSGMTVQQAIALAGGLAERGSNRRISANRLVNGKLNDVSVGLDDKVQANDTINVPQRFF
jgi:polysaccharide export outer membrane protein